jgi:hypothetical protein
MKTRRIGFRALRAVSRASIDIDGTNHRFNSDKNDWILGAQSS